MSDVPGSLNDGLVRVIRAALSGRGLTQKKVAQKAGIHAATMSGYLTDNYAVRTVMTVPVVESIAAALGVDVSALFGEAQKWRSVDWLSIPPDAVLRHSDG